MKLEIKALGFSKKILTLLSLIILSFAALYYEGEITAISVQFSFKNGTALKLIQSPGAATTSSRRCAKNHGYIVANMNGRLANNLFQIAMAKRLSEEICWEILFKEHWQGVFPNEPRASQCFPNALKGWYKYNATNITETDLELYDELHIDNFTDHYWSREKPDKFYWMIRFREAWDLYDKWRIKSEAEGTSLRIGSRQEFDYHPHWLEQLISNLRNPVNESFDRIRAIHLDGYFIHYDWMKLWLHDIREWNQINVTECCHHIPPKNAVVIHIRNFQPEEHLNPGYNTSVFIELLDKMYFRSDNQQQQQRRERQHVLWIVCQPGDTNIDTVQTLKRRYNATVITGNDSYDAFCTLQYARELVLSTHSTFSQMAALLSPFTGDDASTVHYLLPTTYHPEVTLVVPHWHYHLVHTNKSSIKTYNVPPGDIEPIIS